MNGEKGVKITERGWAGHLIFADAYGIGKGIQYAIDIINQKLAEIEE